MGYVQMTIDDWLEIKDKIRKELNNQKHSFVRTGYFLRRIRDEKLYLQDGYKSLTEFAQAEYSLGATYVSRMIAVNEKYSVDGYSEMLDPRFEGFRQGSLTEMLALPDADMEMITPATPREDIRELKRFNAQEPTPEGQGDEHGKLLEAVEEFCKQDRELINDLYAYTPLTATAERDLIEMINPSGSRTFKKGLYFFSFTDTAVKVKKFMKPPVDMSYAEFVGLIVEILGPEKTDKKWEAHFGAEDVQKTEENAQKAAENAQKAAESARKEEKTESRKAESEGTHEKREEDRSVAEKHGEGDGHTVRHEGTHGDADPAPEDHAERAGGPGERTEEDNLPGAGEQEHPQGDQETDGLGKGDLGSTGTDTEWEDEKACRQSEIQEKMTFAPAQIEGQKEDFMNPPEQGDGEDYDKEKVIGILQDITKNVEMGRYLTAERLAEELASYLKNTRRRIGRECS